MQHHSGEANLIVVSFSGENPVSSEIMGNKINKGYNEVLKLCQFVKCLSG